MAPSRTPLNASDRVDGATVPASDPAFARDYLIRFSHCDPAGIIFFPQYLVFTNHLVEDWFTDGMGVDYAHMLGRRRIGLPIVHLESDFRAVSRMGEYVRFALWAERVGVKSLTLSIVASRDGEVRMTARQTLVFTSLATHQSIAIPEDVQRALRGSGAPLR